jgi:transcriptional regulator with XRE-family HTH domain
MMGRVRACVDIITGKGLLVAPCGKDGMAVLNCRGKNHKTNFGKVPIRWNGRQKIYWALKADIEFIDPTVDPEIYVARASEDIFSFPALPSPPNVFEYHYGNNLKRFRRLMGLKQHQLATALERKGIKVSQTTVSYWERNTWPPRGRFLNAVAEILGIPVFIFLLNMDDCHWLQEAQRYVRQLTEKSCEEAPV